MGCLCLTDEHVRKTRRLERSCGSICNDYVNCGDKPEYFSIYRSNTSNNQGDVSVMNYGASIMIIVLHRHCVYMCSYYRQNPLLNTKIIIET